MKLKNKETGETGYLYEHSLTQDIIIVYDVRGIVGKYTSLAKLCEEWEDAPEEPKKHYEILAMGAVMECKDTEDEIFRNQGQREIGNYFETKEEAEKAVEKLKAWKRLKDKGFEIVKWTYDIGDDHHKAGQIVLNLNNVRNIEWDEYDQMVEIEKDLDLLFGGEE